jgi:hypothetical protein
MFCKECMDLEPRLLGGADGMSAIIGNMLKGMWIANILEVGDNLLTHGCGWPPFISLSGEK